MNLLTYFQAVNLRFDATLNGTETSVFPLLFTVTQDEEMITFQLPFNFDEKRELSS